MRSVLCLEHQCAHAEEATYKLTHLFTDSDISCEWAEPDRSKIALVLQESPRNQQLCQCTVSTSMLRWQGGAHPKACCCVSL